MTEAPAPALRPPILAPLILFGWIAGATFAVAWWLGSPASLALTVTGGVVALPVAWLSIRFLPGRHALKLGLGVLFLHLAAGIAGGIAGLPWIEILKFALQGTLLGLAAGLRGSGQGIPTPIAIAVVALPLVLALLARRQVELEGSERLRLQEILAAAIAQGTAFPDTADLHPHTKVWVVDRATARIVASPDGRGGDLGETPLEHPGRMLSEPKGAYATRLGAHAVVVWQAVPGQNDVGVVVIIYEPTSDFSGPLGWELLLMLVVVGMGTVVVGKR